MRNLLNYRFEILIFIVAVGLYANTLNFDYVWDDAIVITQNERVQNGPTFGVIAPRRIYLIVAHKQFSRNASPAASPQQPYSKCHRGTSIFGTDCPHVPPSSYSYYYHQSFDFSRGDDAPVNGEQHLYAVGSSSHASSSDSSSSCSSLAGTLLSQQQQHRFSHVA